MAEFQNQFSDQLREYRLQQRRKKAVNNFKTKLRNFMMFGKAKDDTVVIVENSAPTSESTHTSDTYGSDYTISDEEKENEAVGPTIPDPRTESKLLKYSLWVVYFLFWVTLYVIAIELKFGLVFLMFSALFGIYFNTRTGPKQRNEISAYSVFNKDFQSIDGTLKAEQFEREIRYGSGSVR